MTELGELRRIERRYDLILPDGNSESRLERLEAITRSLLEKNAQLERALESRIVIEQAKGKLAERLGVEVDEAFEVLRFAARSAQLKLHDLAAGVVASSDNPPAVHHWLARERA
jgi:DNA-directed RNA polymerase specialized sigma subunit